MCGIAGAVGRFAPGEADRIVQSMVSALTHRGPDDSGIHTCSFGNNVITLGHTRLSILDLSDAGHQPMTEPSGRYWTVFNGEVYNFREIRKLLDPENRIFRTGTDTEAILHAYHRWSVEGFSLFRGMFAFAFLDKETRLLRLVRDPFGIKPLYYHCAGDSFLFASEVGALLASDRIPRRIDSSAVAHFLNRGWAGKTSTAISGIKMLQPGQVLTLDLKGDAVTQSLSTFEPEFKSSVPPIKQDRSETVAHVLHLLEQSVKCHLVSDVPIGLFLSGGIDSTAILHLMRQAGCNSPKTFTVVFPEESFSERRFAKMVAERYDAEHHELDLTESDLFNQLPSALNAMDQPTMDGVNTYVIASAVRSAGVKVALSGLGSDELFAGYPSFRRALWAGLASKAPVALRALLANGGKTVWKGPRNDKFWDLLGSDCSALSAYQISRRLFNASEIVSLTGAEPNLSGEALHRTFPDDEINQVSQLEMRGYMTDLLLRDTDFMSMASSLEVRVPFIDKAVVRHVLQLPGRWKLAPSVPKPLLLEAMRGAIPDYVWNRRKMGFVLPFDNWMRSALRPQFEETLCDRQLAQAIGLLPSAVEHVWRGFLNGVVRWSKPWSLFVLMRWCERRKVSI